VLDVHLKTGKTFFRRKKTLALQVHLSDLEVGDHFLASLYESCLLAFFQEEFLLNKTVVNKKGRDSSNPPSKSRSKFPLHKDEFLFVSGNFVIKESKDEGEELLETTPFTMQTLSSFKSFPTGKDIEFTITENYSATLPEWLTPYGLMQWEQITFQELRFGIEYFSSRFSGLGYGPTVRERIACEATPIEAVVSLHSDDFSDQRAAWKAMLQFFDIVDRLAETSIGNTIRQKLAHA
jgi:hypothetical protein